MQLFYELFLNSLDLKKYLYFHCIYYTEQNNVLLLFLNCSKLKTAKSLGLRTVFNNKKKSHLFEITLTSQQKL